MRKIDCVHSRNMKTFGWPLKSAKNSKKIKFKVNKCENMGKNTYFFKGQTKVFMLQEYPQSIFRIKLPLNMSFF